MELLFAFFGFGIVFSFMHFNFPHCIPVRNEKIAIPSFKL